MNARPYIAPKDIARSTFDGRAIDRRFQGPPHHERIPPPFPLWLKLYLLVFFAASVAAVVAQ